MSRPRFANWARRYATWLAHTEHDRFDLARIARIAEHDHPRAQAPLLLWAIQTGRTGQLLAATRSPGLRAEYQHAIDALDGMTPEEHALGHAYTRGSTDRYRKVLNSFHTTWHRPENNAMLKRIHLESCRRSLATNPTIDPYATAGTLGLSHDSVRRFLNGDTTRLGLDNATRLARALRAETNATTNPAGPAYKPGTPRAHDPTTGTDRKDTPS